MKKVFALFLLSCFLLSHLQSEGKKRNDEREFMSLAYVQLKMLGMYKMEPKEIVDLLDQYRWEGITDIALLGSMFTAGVDGQLLTSWNKESWPPVFEGLDYKGNPINEEETRATLCSKRNIETLVKYFKKKDLKLWISVKAAGWLTGGSLGVVLEDEELTKKYAAQLYDFAKQLACYGVDFDWEFPPTAEQGHGYRELMKETKRLGMRVSVCAIRPTAGKEYLANCFAADVTDINEHAGKHMKWEKIIGEEMVDQINVMQYLSYNPNTKQLDVNVKLEQMLASTHSYFLNFKRKAKAEI